ncbi:MAG TPA: hypothetical protein VH088_21205 [Terriglobales bacterium]|jgi:hypothetical protein|nr:hypothetical protein [Terriglobales bacterium]
MRRRDLLKGAVLLPAAAAALAADVPEHLWQGYDFGSGPRNQDRLNQGPFDVTQDQGWQPILFTTASEKPVRNPGLGLIGYTWEEGGPSLDARAGRETLEQHVEKMSSLPFVDVLYIRCDWRNVQSQAGKLDLNPVFKLTMDAAKRKGLRFAFRVQLSNESFQPEDVALPQFLREKIPLVNIGPTKKGGQYREPRYDHPEFQKAFAELNDLLAAEFEGNPLLEWMDLMQYGFWGEGHTGALPSPFPDYLTAERTFVGMTQRQIDTWKKTPLAVNTQPDISNVGNRTVADMAVRAGAWLRSDSILVEEPIQIEELTNRPPWLATILEDGGGREYDIDKLKLGDDGLNMLEKKMLHALDAKANYWALWTEASNLARYNEKFPRGFERLQTNLGYRIRPAWVWQRKRYGTYELIVCVSNRGVAGVPGVLWLQVESADHSFKLEGTLDAGHPYGGSSRQASFILPKGYLGKVQISAQIEIRPGVKKPVAWACEQTVNTDGSITFELKGDNDRGWRKGV